VIHIPRVDVLRSSRRRFRRHVVDTSDSHGCRIRTRRQVQNASSVPAPIRQVSAQLPNGSGCSSPENSKTLHREQEGFGHYIAVPCSGMTNRNSRVRRTFWSYIADLWCRLMHPDPMWPLHGYYRCAACWREYPVPWENRAGLVTQQSRCSSLRAAPGQPIEDSIGRPAVSW